MCVCVCVCDVIIHQSLRCSSLPPYISQRCCCCCCGLHPRGVGPVQRPIPAAETLTNHDRYSIQSRRAGGGEAGSRPRGAIPSISLTAAGVVESRAEWALARVSGTVAFLKQNSIMGFPSDDGCKDRLPGLTRGTRVLLIATRRRNPSYAH